VLVVNINHPSQSIGSRTHINGGKKQPWLEIPSDAGEVVNSGYCPPFLGSEFRQWRDPTFI
jgi:hypothetical protein